MKSPRPLTVSDCDTGQAEGFITAACDFEDRVRAETVSNWLARPLNTERGSPPHPEMTSRQAASFPTLDTSPNRMVPRSAKGGKRT